MNLFCFWSRVACYGLGLALLFCFVSPAAYAHDDCCSSGVLSDAEVVEAYHELIQKMVTNAAIEARFQQSGITASQLVTVPGGGVFGIPTRMPSAELIAPVFEELVADLEAYYRKPLLHRHHHHHADVRWPWLWRAMEAAYFFSSNFNHSVEGALNDVYVGVKRYGAIGGTAGGIVSGGIEIAEHGGPWAIVTNKFPFCSYLQFLVWRKLVNPINKAVSPLVPWAQRLKARKIVEFHPTQSYFTQLALVLRSTAASSSQSFDFNFAPEASYSKRIHASYARMMFELSFGKFLYRYRGRLSKNLKKQNQPPVQKSENTAEMFEKMAARYKRLLVKFGSEHQIVDSLSLMEKNHKNVSGTVFSDLDLIFEKGLWPESRRVLVNLHTETLYTLVTLQEELIRRESHEKMTFLENMQWKGFSAHQKKSIDNYQTGLQLLVSQVELAELNSKELQVVRQKVETQLQELLRYIKSAAPGLNRIVRRSSRDYYRTETKGLVGKLQSSCSMAFASPAGKGALSFAKTGAYAIGLYKLGGATANATHWLFFGGEHDHHGHDSHDHHGPSPR